MDLFENVVQYNGLCNFSVFAQASFAYFIVFYNVFGLKTVIFKTPEGAKHCILRVRALENSLK